MMAECCNKEWILWKQNCTSLLNSTFVLFWIIWTRMRPLVKPLRKMIVHRFSCYEL
jgi:hypothetical protein